ncbi:NAD(+) diphosphatase [Pseudonocardia sp. GCM10023141]|uniref:NAD(+) diphosphatase n=1 Tax=Pseudonocardia sp. GCM10023141 TaxID=3252653 RepID=UPI003607227F
MADAVLPYNGSPLDRAGRHRADPRWLAEVASRPSSRTLLLWRDRALVGPHGPVTLATGDPAGLPAEPVLLGLDGDAGVFAADLSTLAEPAAIALGGARAAVEVRHLFGSVDAATSAQLAHARGLLLWHRNQRFCGACGAPTESRDRGQLRACTGCGKLHFQRIEPAVIVLVQAPNPPARCLLGRHRGAAPNAWATLAGFVEIGEGLEGAVQREMAEEAGIELGAITYLASQSWPFPSGLMIGFSAVALSEEIDVDGDELQEARWFTAAEVAALQEEHRAAGTHRSDSIEQYLVQTWLAAQRVP